MKYVLIIVIIALLPAVSRAGEFMRDSSTLSVVSEGIDYVYNYEFEKADQSLDLLKMKYPSHPVTPFMEGLICYWKYYPLIPGEKGSGEFESLMERSIQFADEILQENSEDTEGVFFDLMARCFLVMYQADNGHSSKAMQHLNNIYRGIIKGFDQQAAFREFYFITGLYNYYIEAYPEAHPVYKPITIFFRNGDKNLGLEMLNFAADSTIFLKVEAGLFLSLIYMNYEDDPENASRCAERLSKSFPGNGYFKSRYTEMLLINHHYETANQYIDSLLLMDRYNLMAANVFRGMYLEKQKLDFSKARLYYYRGIDMAESYGPRGDHYKAYAYAGLGRYYSSAGQTKKSKENFKKAKACTNYTYQLQ